MSKVLCLYLTFIGLLLPVYLDFLLSVYIMANSGLVVMKHCVQPSVCERESERERLHCLTTRQTLDYALSVLAKCLRVCPLLF